MRNLVLTFGLIGTFSVTAPAYAGTITYTDRVTFQAALGASVTDNYSASGYQTGDSSSQVDFDVFSNAGMSAVLGETDYLTTG